MTKKYKGLKNLFGILSFLCSVGPLAYFLGVAMLNGDIAVSKKVGLTFSVILAFILVLLNNIRKYNLRSPFYILIIGIHLCIESLLSLFIILGVTCILDEFIFTPLKKKYKAKYVINKEMDNRNE